jgi:hypothetical protein
MALQFGKKIEEPELKPYQDDVFNRAYEQFFCDDIEAFRTSIAEQTPPWDYLLSRQNDPEKLREIVGDDSAESRVKIFAHRLLHGGADHLYGAVVEVAIDKHLNVVAAYRDGSARAINNGRLIDWENLEDLEIREAIVTFLSASQFAMTNLDRWTKSRLPFPNRGLARFSIMSSDGFYFGQGSMEKMLKDPLGQPVMEAGMDLMMKLSMKAK